MSWIPLERKCVMSGYRYDLLDTFRGEREAQHSWWEVAEVWSKPWLLAEPLVDLNIGSLPGTRVRDEVIK